MLFKYSGKYVNIYFNMKITFYFQAATMSGRESSPKISLALLKGRSAAQSVPSISFRFKPSEDNVTQVSDTEDGMLKIF